MHLGTVGSNSIEILWTDGGAPADSYTEVYFRRHNAATWTAQVLAANRTSWLHQGLSAGQSWDYKVRDCDANGCSAFSNMVTGFVAGTGYTLTVTRHGTGTVSSVPARHQLRQRLLGHVRQWLRGDARSRRRHGRWCRVGLHRLERRLHGSHVYLQRDHERREERDCYVPTDRRVAV